MDRRHVLEHIHRSYIKMCVDLVYAELCGAWARRVAVSWSEGGAGFLSMQDLRLRIFQRVDLFLAFVLKVC